MNLMPSLIRQSGLFGPALVLLGAVVLFLSARAVWTMGRRTVLEESVLKTRVDAVLFWGVASAVLGFLGQCEGAYLALSAILAAQEISPAVVAQGFVISFLPTLFGLGILAFAFVVWVSLRILPGKGGSGLALLLAILVASGCGEEAREVPSDLAEGLWTLHTDPNLFLWEFSTDSGGKHSCMVPDVLGGLKYTETPCASVDLKAGGQNHH
jgi:hypothetical protein